MLTDAQSFYNSFQFSVSQHSTDHVSWQAYYTLAHSIDDASTGLIIEAVNEPPGSQNIFDRKGSRGRSSFDIRHNFVANVVALKEKQQLSRFNGATVRREAHVPTEVHH